MLNRLEALYVQRIVEQLKAFYTGLGTHRWYLEHFGESYPSDRKAIFPYLI